MVYDPKNGCVRDPELSSLPEGESTTRGGLSSKEFLPTLPPILTACPNCNAKLRVKDDGSAELREPVSKPRSTWTLADWFGLILMVAFLVAAVRC